MPQKYSKSNFWGEKHKNQIFIPTYCARKWRAQIISQIYLLKIKTYLIIRNLCISNSSNNTAQPASWLRLRKKTVVIKSQHTQVRNKTDPVQYHLWCHVSHVGSIIPKMSRWFCSIGILEDDSNLHSFQIWRLRGLQFFKGRIKALYIMLWDYEEYPWFCKN